VDLRIPFLGRCFLASIVGFIPRELSLQLRSI
jgi:hypothetical protein